MDYNTKDNVKNKTLVSLQETIQTIAKITEEFEVILRPILTNSHPTSNQSASNPENQLQEIRNLAQDVRDQLKNLIQRIDL